MDQAVTSRPSTALVDENKAKLVAKALTWGVILSLAVGFVLKYVFHYYLHYDEASFTPYWSRREWLLLHISGGTLALLAGPWQLWTGFRQKHLRLHRWTGRLFLLGVTMASTGAFYLAFTTTFGWAWGVALFALASALVTTAGMAYYAIRRGLVQIHKEWMVRTYVLTFAFVTFRLLNDFGPTSHVQPVTDRIITYGWLSWVVPLLVAEVILELRRMREGPRRTNMKSEL